MSRALENKKRIFRYKVDQPNEFSNNFSDIKEYSSTDVEQSYTSIKQSTSPHVSKVVIALVVATVAIVGVIVTLVIVLPSSDENKDITTTAIPQPTETPEKITASTPQTTTSPATGNYSYNWSLWGEWTQCTATCGFGIHTRYRHCNEELSSLCLGDYVETDLCAELSCPVIGKWTTWSSWGSCDVTCGGGSHIRTRNCNKSDEFDKDCSGETSQKKTCSNWSCPDCSQICAVGVLNDRCDACICENTHITGRILAKATGNPVIGAALYARTAPTQLLALTNSTGFFSLNASCTSSELQITKEGFVDTIATVNDTFIEINLTRIVKPFLTEIPQSKCRLTDENVTFCCKASANPEITYYEWFKDSILLEKHIFKGDTQLTLAYLNRSDSGNYQCRANNDEGAIMSPFAVLTVRDAPDDFCSDALQQKTIFLPDECMQPGSNTSAFEVGDCLGKKCRLNDMTDGGACGEEINSCCSVKEYQVETINCTDYELDLIVIKSCGCGRCTPSEALISGVVSGLEDEAPVPFASVYLNGELKGYTTMMGTFEFNANITTSRWTITIQDDIHEDFLPASKVIDVFTDISGIINVDIKMIRASEPVEIDSAVENTIQAGSSNGSNVLLLIPANAFSYKNGSNFSGTVKARLTYLDPSNTLNIEHIPGVFQYVDSEGLSGDLESLGVFNLYFEDQSGQPVVPKQAIDAYIPIENGDNETYEEFKLWTLNTQTGIWELEDGNTEDLGSRKRRQRIDAWVGTLTDVSTRKWYNYDKVSRLTNNQCYFKIRVFKDNLLRESVDNLLNRIRIHTNIIRGRTLHTIKHFTKYPKSYCVNVPCDNEIAYITGRTNRQILFPGTPHPSNGTRYWISSDKTVLKTKMTSAAGGPFLSSKRQCVASSNTDSYLSFSYGMTNFKWKFQTFLTYCDPTIKPSIRLRYWYPCHGSNEYRACFVKIKIHFQAGISIGKNGMKIRVFSYGGNNKEIKDMILGIHESKVDDSDTYCIEYRCSGPIDPCNGMVSDNTKVKIIFEYPVSSIQCAIDDIAADLHTRYYRYSGIFQFSAPHVDGDYGLGIYTRTKTNNDPYVAIPLAVAASESYCKAGTLDQNDKSKVNSGYAVSFYCERR